MELSWSDQIRSVAQSCPTLCDPMNRSMPGLPVYHQLQEFTQTHVHRVGDAIQPSHPLLSPFPSAPNPSQHESFPISQFFSWGGQRTGVSALASFLPKKSQGWSSEWTFYNLMFCQFMPKINCVSGGNKVDILVFVNYFFLIVFIYLAYRDNEL